MMLAAEALPTLLEYCPDTGVLRWRQRPQSAFGGGVHARRACASWNSKWAGKEAFTATSRGYRTGRIYDRQYFAHRVAWAMQHGAWPSAEIDHINGKKADNRISNLREVGHATNGQNCPRISTNSSGRTGVSWDRKGGVWVAYIGDGNARRRLGRFSDRSAAIEARVSAERAAGYHMNHGRIAA